MNSRKHVRLADSEELTLYDVPLVHTFDVIEYFASVSEHRPWKHFPEHVDSSSLPIPLQIRQFIRNHFQPTIWLFLILVGAIASLIGYWTDFFVQQIHGFKRDVTQNHFILLDWFIWVLLSTFLAVCSHACIVFISPEAKGSGIPEMKSILGGVLLRKYLSLKSFIARFIGTVAVLSSGLSVGKEGPFVHMACAAAYQISLYKPFSSVINTPGLRRQVLAAAVAAGVTATFGAPLGATLFSIEVTATFFTVSSLWKTFFCSVMTVVVLEFFHALGLVDLFNSTEFEVFDFSWQIILFCVLGVIMGLGSALFIKLAAFWMIFLRRRTRYSSIYSSDLKVLLLVSVFTSLCTFWFFRESDAEIINRMFQKDPLEDWDLINLPVFFAFKSLLTSISISLALPAGIFTPIFTAGAVFGRWFGELLSSVSDQIEPGTYAVAGAAGFTAGITRSISTALIVFELTGQLNHLLPVLLVVLVSYSLCASFTISIYDLILRTKGLPHLPSLDVSDREKTAFDVLNPQMCWIDEKASYADAAQVLQETELTQIALVENKMLVAAVPRRVVQSRVDARIQEYMQQSDLSGEIKFEHDLETFMDVPLDWTSFDTVKDVAPYQVTSKTPLPKVHYLFTMLELGQVFVVDKGEILGSISIDDLS